MVSVLERSRSAHVPLSRPPPSLHGYELIHLIEINDRTPSPRLIWRREANVLLRLVHLISSRAFNIAISESWTARVGALETQPKVAGHLAGHRVRTLPHFKALRVGKGIHRVRRRWRARRDVGRELNRAGAAGGRSSALETSAEIGTIRRRQHVWIVVNSEIVVPAEIPRARAERIEVGAEARGRAKHVRTRERLRLETVVIELGHGDRKRRRRFGAWSVHFELDGSKGGGVGQDTVGSQNELNSRCAKKAQSSSGNRENDKDAEELSTLTYCEPAQALTSLKVINVNVDGVGNDPETSTLVEEKAQCCWTIFDEL